MTLACNLCECCDHFVDRNIDRERYSDVAMYIHLDGHDREYDHDAWPRDNIELVETDWETERPDLFVTYADGMIGPNSIHFVHQRSCSEERKREIFDYSEKSDELWGVGLTGGE